MYQSLCIGHELGKSTLKFPKLNFKLINSLLGTAVDTTNVGSVVMHVWLVHNLCHNGYNFFMFDGSVCGQAVFRLVKNLRHNKDIFFQRGKGIIKMSLLFILVHQEAEKLTKRKGVLFLKCPVFFF